MHGEIQCVKIGKTGILYGVCFWGRDEMAYIVKYNVDKIHMAYSLIKLKSNEDDVKAGEDLFVLDSILNGNQTCVDIYVLDERLRKEYKTIEKLEKIQKEFCYDDGKSTNGFVTENERMISRLKSDRAGIIADILIKHEKIKSVEEVYERRVQY